MSIHSMFYDDRFSNDGGSYEPCHEKTCLCHPCSWISTFVVRYLGSIIPILAKSKISRH